MLQPVHANTKARPAGWRFGEGWGLEKHQFALKLMREGLRGWGLELPGMERGVGGGRAKAGVPDLLAQDSDILGSRGVGGGAAVIMLVVWLFG